MKEDLLQFLLSYTVTYYLFNINQRQICASMYIFMPIIPIYILLINGIVWEIEVETLAEYFLRFIICKNGEQI